MKIIFIGGAREIKKLPIKVEEKLEIIYKKNYNIIIGDANGVDKIVQQYFYNYNYKNIEIFTVNKTPRNNIGNWNIKNIETEKNLKGFNLYKQKDLAMAKNADLGFMIWNGNSKGTLNNIINLLKLNKKTVLYFKPENSLKYIENFEQLNELIENKNPNLINIYKKLLIENNEQLTLL